MTVYTPFCTSPRRLSQLKPESKWFFAWGRGRTEPVTRIRTKFIDYWLAQVLGTKLLRTTPELHRYSRDMVSLQHNVGSS